MRSLVDSLTRWDTAFLTTIFGLEGRRFLSSAMPWFSHSGNGYYYPLLPLILFLYDPQVAKIFFLGALVAFGIELPAYKILKSLIKRDRPCVALPVIHSRITPGDQFSFPSGHTAAAAIVATLISHFLPLLMPVAVGWAFMVGLSRVYLGVHYPTDIVAGTFLGLICAIIGLTVVL
jgi:undecaprenyl-diphosphatase